MSYLIETFSLTKKFPVIKGYRDLLLHPFAREEIPALQNVNLQVKKGELFGLLGPNGAGKTTLIKILCTLILPTSGEAFINGRDVTTNGKDIRKTIGYVIGDERSFYWRLSGRQNLVFFAKLNNITRRESEERIARLLNFMELERYADRLFKDYSTGMRQKLAIARGLLTDPDIIFMDEPTNGLDPVTAQNLKTLVKEKLIKEERRTIVFATHNLQDAEELCNRFAIMHDGEIKFSGTLEDIKMKFCRNKIYVMKLMRPKDDLLGRIKKMPLIKKIVSYSSLPGIMRIEIEIGGDNPGITEVVKEIIDKGGVIHSFYEKENSLKELFPGIIDKQ